MLKILTIITLAIVIMAYYHLARSLRLRAKNRKEALFEAIKPVKEMAALMDGLDDKIRFAEPGAIEASLRVALIAYTGNTLRPETLSYLSTGEGLNRELALTWIKARITASLILYRTKLLEAEIAKKYLLVPILQERIADLERLKSTVE